MSRLCVLILASCLTYGAQLITDEPVRRAALSTAFPETSISLLAKTESGRSGSANPSSGVAVVDLVGFHDLFEKERVYTVTGPATDDIEKCAAQDVASLEIRDERAIRFRL